MKLGDVRYLTKEGIKSTWANRLMTLASIGVLVACMVVIGLAVLISENGNKALGHLEKQNIVMAYMKDYSWALDMKTNADTADKTASEQTAASKSGNSSEKGDVAQDGAAAETPDENGIKNSDYVIHSDEEAKKLCKQIGKIDNVKNVEFISSEEGLKNVAEQLGKDESNKKLVMELLKDDNPLPRSAKITMTSMDEFDSTVKAIEELEGISNVRSQGDAAKKILSIKNGVQIAGIWMISILLLISLVIVSNTIRITMYNRKLEISIMKAVGATNSFVRLPFIVEGITIGLISAVISEGLLYFCYRVVTDELENVLGGAVIPFSHMALILLGIFAAIGTVSGVIGSSIMISKYLRKEGSEFAAI